ncbi:hypothetical protein [[Clostridium] hylemonae]|uniref:hypothetical protein n=1 Tax=[Clostridium] hylemonae TaxID=89153 RepID=UPI001D06B8A5|nr:hypothetical protein [[Clostridium] hylemonae]MCB7522599.1 hypothetical protein [[Clostridium] hylemonae]BDF04256.1 hypothetical protein CE91St63_13180 [[Clostridium] hylemonae]
MAGWTFDEIEQLIVETMDEVTGVKITDYNQHLLSAELDIPIADFLYVIDELEKRIGHSITKLFEKEEYTVFNVKDLSAAIMKVITA